MLVLRDLNGGRVKAFAGFVENEVAPVREHK
jgi:hypothetical protein